jgi:hypothetical protein
MEEPPPPTLLPLPIPYGTENKTKGPEQNPKTQNSLNKDNDINFIYLFKMMRIIVQRSNEKKNRKKKRLNCFYLFF